MVTFTSLLAEILQLDDSKGLPSIPGHWEELEADLNEFNMSRFWGHSIDGGFTDCVLEVDFDDLYVKNVVISIPKFTWRVHHLHVEKGPELRRVPVATPQTDAVTDQVVAAVRHGIEQSRRQWKTCTHCGDSQPVAYMQEPHICMGCAPDVLGIVY